MLKINLICVGNLKEKYWKQAEEEYLKRLTRFYSVSVIEIEEQNQKGTPEQIKNAEGELLATKLKGKVVLLDIFGDLVSSTVLAQKLENWQTNYSEISFVIGGSYGVSDKIKNLADAKLSFSPLTFPHQLARIMLLEQIYRSATITNHICYHK